MKKRKAFKLLVTIDGCVNCPERKAIWDGYYCATTLETIDKAVRLVDENMYNLTMSCPHWIRAE